MTKVSSTLQPKQNVHPVVRSNHYLIMHRQWNWENISLGRQFLMQKQMITLIFPTTMEVASTAWYRLEMLLHNHITFRRPRSIKTYCLKTPLKNIWKKWGFPP